MPDLETDIASAVSLDYNASVDMNDRAPISITVQDDGSGTGTAKPPGVRLRDYIPGSARAAKIAGRPPRVLESQPHRRGIILERDGTYISGSEMRKRKDKRHGRMVELAKKLYREKKVEIVEYLASLNATQRATAEEKVEPKKKMRRALKIVKLGHPMTKKMAMDKAREMIEKQLRKKG